MVKLISELCHYKLNDNKPKKLDWTNTFAKSAPHTFPQHAFKCKV